MYTNINITNNTDQFKYIIEYIPRDVKYHNLKINYSNGVDIRDRDDICIDDIVFLYDENDYIGKYNDHWYNTVPSHDYKYVPNDYNVGSIRLYFPLFSVDTYHNGHKYAININIKINGKNIVLGTHIVSRYDACATNKIFFNDTYYEYVDFPIIDPNDLVYSDEWEEWRKNVCKEDTSIDFVNSDSSMMSCSLYPVIESDGEYMKLNGYEGGQNYIRFNDGDSYLNLNISTNTTNSLATNEQPAVLFELSFNKYYESLKDYLFETYGGKSYKAEYELVIGNSDNIYATYQSGKIDLVSSYRFNKDTINENNFDNGIGWEPGIYMVGSVNIIDDDGESVLYLLSNKIPFTEEVLKYFIKTDFVDKNGLVVNNIKLNEVNMNLLNINAVNKIENKIIKVDKIGDNRSNIHQTIFFRVSDLNDLVIKPEINENVCINLDLYKHLVKSFVIQIEGIKFTEIGRNKSGVIFKIIGNKLPRKINSGQYYILNQDFESITGGKYTYLV